MIYLAADGVLVGFLSLADTLRPDAADTVRRVREAGVEPVLLTGDHANAACHIAQALGIQTVRSDCLPEDKLNWIGAEQEKGRQVCMVERCARPEKSPSGHCHGGCGQ